MRVARAAVVTWLGLSGVCVGACAAGGGRPAPRTATATATATSCVASGASTLRPVLGPGARSGGGVVLASAGPRSFAFVADEDDALLHTVDLDRDVEVSTTPLAGAPSHALVTRDGRVVVLLRDRAQIEVLEPAADPAQPLVERCRVGTADEPVDLALTPDDATLVVTSGWGARLSAYDARALAASFDVRLPREPRAVVVSEDGGRAFVSHMVGAKLTVVDLASHRAMSAALKFQPTDGTAELRRAGPVAFKPREACQGFALAKMSKPTARVFAPQVLVDVGEQRASGYGDPHTPTEEPSIAAISDRDGALTPDSIAVGLHVSRGVERPGCLLPRAAAVEETRGELFVTCLGEDVVVAYDAHAASPQTRELRRWHVAAGPTAIAVDGAKGRAVVWSQFDRTVSVLDLGGPSFEDQLTASQRPVLNVPLSRRPQPPTAYDVALGRRLFHAAGDPRLAADGRACASCHPDGRDDALTWATPEGPRQTPSLAGRLAGTAPYSWMGNKRDVRHHLAQTLARLRGRGLDDHEVDALAAYAMTMAPPPRAAPTDADTIARGLAIYRSPQTGCSSCHGADGATPDGHLHDVQSGDETTREFDTPSLRFVGGTGPYFHDGRYVTLREVLVDADGTMGRTHHLSPSELDALEAFLRTL